MGEAEAACALIGANWRVCTATSGRRRAGGSPRATAPLRRQLRPRGLQRQRLHRGGEAPAPIASGAATSCVSTITASTTPLVTVSTLHTLFDMSGNVKEWTATDLTTKNPLTRLHDASLPLRAARRRFRHFQLQRRGGHHRARPGLHRLHRRALSDAPHRRRDEDPGHRRPTPLGRVPLLLAGDVAAMTGSARIERKQRRLMSHRLTLRSRHRRGHPRGDACARAVAPPEHHVPVS